MQVRKVDFYHKSQVTEIEEKIEDETYYLVPDHHFVSKTFYEKTHHYDELDKVSQKQFDRPEVIRDSEFSDNLLTQVKEVLPPDICKMLIEQSKESLDAIYHPDFLTSLLPMIITEEVDSMLCSHFNSEYTLLWYSYVETPVGLDKRALSSYWHCDGGPSKHVKMLIYLNAYEDHLGNTKFLTKASTDKLKRAGYIFGDIAKRTENIGPLCRDRDISMAETMYDDIEAGDALLFNPNQLAHIGKIPEIIPRQVLQLCFIQSPYHWEYTRDTVMSTLTGVEPFEGRAQEILKFYHSTPEEQADRVMISASGDITSPEHLRLLLRNMYAGDAFADMMFDRLIEADPNLEELNTVNALLETLRQSFKYSIDWDGDLGIENMNNLSRLAAYQVELEHSFNRYSPINKPDPSGIFWPSPDHPSKPSTKYGMLPFVKKHPIMDMDTPIGSAGSCFAFEIARVFQEMGYNYVVTERNDDPDSGIVIDGYEAGDKNAKFCANYGILFNTPSFRQLAERAFGVKKTKQILFQQDDRGWVDPYRENVLFYTKQDYLNDYEQHIEATRDALERAEIFIVTLGLNECWQFRDGTVMSRNPRPNMYPLVTHKTLTVQENVDNIQAFFDIVREHNPDFKLIISVSPIPFLATGRAEEHHVISANTHSKAVLRVAAEQLVTSNQDMYYLPSYELVTECLEDAWDTDQRHVKSSTVEQVVEMFKEIFIV